MQCHPEHESSSRRVNVLGLLFCTRGPEFHLIGHFEYTSKSNTEFQESFMSLCMIFYLSFCISQFHLRPAPLPPGYCCEAFSRLVSPGGEALANFHCPGAGHLPTPGPFPSFRHVRGFLSEYNYNRGFYWKKSRQRVIRACS